MAVFVFALTCVFSILLWGTYRKHYRQVMTARGNLLINSEKVFSVKRHQIDRAGFSSVSGIYKGKNVSLKLEVDNLTPRKLPIMWVHINMKRPAGSTGSLDILVRPQPSDVFSPGWNWQKTVTPLKSWPEHARYSSQGEVPPLQAIDKDVRTIFADQHAKELLITPEFVRLTYLVRQADRGHYLLLRTAEFDMQPIDSAKLSTLIRKLEEVQKNLDWKEDDEITRV